MRIVFMNQMINASDNEVAQVWIGEEEGGWRVAWGDIKADGNKKNEVWYEGNSWEELISIYRGHLSKKISEGYRPAIAGISCV